MKIALGIALAITLVVLSLSLGHTKSTDDYRWVKAIDTGVKTWPRWVLPVSKGDQALLMIAKEGTWSSSDGVNWRTAANNASAAVRPGVAQAFFKDKFWLMGGMIDWSQFTNEVWSSSDGRSWSRVVNNAPWSPRRNALVTVFNDRLWMFGGWESSGLRDVTPRRSYRDAWVSDDGLTWKQLPTILPKSDEQVVVFQNQLWLLGKAGAWASLDGINWAQKSSGKPFDDRGAYGALVYKDRIWMFGGLNGPSTTNEVWSSADGIKWVRETNAPWFPRGGEYSAVFKDKLWIYGGKTGSTYDQADDVWYLTK